MSATKSSLEFKSILFSYLDPDGNYLEHEMLQRGVLWGIGTYLESNPLDLDEKTKGLLFGYLHSFDPVKTGGNKSKTAKILGVGRTTLYRFIAQNTELIIYYKYILIINTLRIINGKQHKYE